MKWNIILSILLIIYKDNFFKIAKIQMFYLKTLKRKLDWTNNKLENFNSNTMLMFEKKFMKLTDDYKVY